MTQGVSLKLSFKRIQLNLYFLPGDNCGPDSFSAIQGNLTCESNCSDWTQDLWVWKFSLSNKYLGRGDTRCYPDLLWKVGETYLLSFPSFLFLDPIALLSPPSNCSQSLPLFPSSFPPPFLTPSPWLPFSHIIAFSSFQNLHPDRGLRKFHT